MVGGVIEICEVDLQTWSMMGGDSILAAFDVIVSDTAQLWVSLSRSEMPS